MNTNRSMILTMLGIAMLAGCSGSEPPRPTPPAVVYEPTPPPPPPTVPKPPEMVQKKAEVGVGDKGRGYGQGIVATPVAAYFSTRERIAFDIQIPEALKLFKAAEDRAPKRTKSSWRRSSRPTTSTCDAAPSHRYVYDPKQEQLMVEQPRGSSD